LRSGPKAFAWIRFSGVVVHPADQITPAGHSRELTADSPQRQRESATQHAGGTPSVYGLGCGVGAEVQGAPYGETLPATGRTTRILKRPKRVCADSLPANSAASAFIPPKSALPWRAPQPTMGLVLDGKGNIVGHTLANDVSIWGIERENPLYLRNRRSTRGR
jgi:hypothetical protein